MNKTKMNYKALFKKDLRTQTVKQLIELETLICIEYSTVINFGSEKDIETLFNNVEKIREVIREKTEEN